MGKIGFSVIIPIITLSGVFIYWTNETDSKTVAPVITGFYGIFIEKDYSNMYKYTDFSKHSQHTDLTMKMP
ncbi:hypothetical protein WMW72_11285 [Paenibacillus filicis]|uniref:Uncharacterized protein n=1 Tax=Paenibacillus filicis TaxID=669464 RepID=A0ABU9DI93_9BACL